MDGPIISQYLSNGLFLLFIVGIPLYAALRKINVYDSFIDGAKDAFPLMLKIVPHLIAMLVALGMLRASGAIDMIAVWIAPALDLIGMPAETLPLALVRPFSGSAANGVMAELIQTHGGDSFIAKVAATMMGSTETTFYVIAIYFGAVAIKRTRHAIPTGLVADAVGILAAVWVCHWLFI